MTPMMRALGAALLPAAVIGSYANIKGVCNHYSSWVHFTNTEASGNNCDAAPIGGNCDAHRAFIPKCENPTDYNGHHMQVRSDDGRVDIKLWKSDGMKKIRGGRDYATASDLADEVSKGEWNVVINPNGGVYLYLTSDPHDCPPPPPAPCTAKQVKGHWQYQYMIAAPTTESWKHGTSKTHAESRTETWSKSVTISVSEGFEMAGESSSVKVDTTISHSVAQSYSDEWSTNDEHDFQIAFQSSDVGKAAWQFVFDENDSCSHAEHTLLREYALTPNAGVMPCCVPGFTRDAPHYTTCTSKGALVPGVKNCKVAAEEEPVVV